MGDGMRVAVLKEDNCQPKKCNDECQVFCPPVRNGQECIVMDEQTGKPHISESLCIGCGICINKCPHDALIIENLPSELETDMIHRYSMNGFRLFRLPTPSKESVVGILGPNGMGKSTAISALSGRMTPNLGDWLDQEPDWESVIASLPKGELRDFSSPFRKAASVSPSSRKTWINSPSASKEPFTNFSVKSTSEGCSSKPPVRWALTTCSSEPFNKSLEENSSAWPFVQPSFALSLIHI